MGCMRWSKFLKNLLTFLLSFVLPLGLLVVTTFASTTSFSPNCSMRVDLLAILHCGALMLIAFHVLFIYIFPGAGFGSLLAERIVSRFIQMTALLPVPVLVLMIVIVANRDDICYSESTYFSIVWFFVISGIFTLGLAVIGVIELCSILNRRRRFRTRRFHLRVEHNQKMKLLSSKLMSLRHTRAGWETLCREFWPIYMNLQDYQKESLLPIFVLYAMDELTWELRDVRLDLQNKICVFCAQGMERDWSVVCSMAFNTAMHRYCLNSQVYSEPTQILRDTFFEFSHSGCEALVAFAEDWLNSTQGTTVTLFGNGVCKKLGVFGKTHQEAIKTLASFKEKTLTRARRLRITVNNIV